VQKNGQIEREDRQTPTRKTSQPNTSRKEKQRTATPRQRLKAKSDKDQPSPFPHPNGGHDTIETKSKKHGKAKAFNKSNMSKTANFAKSSCHFETFWSNVRMPQDPFERRSKVAAKNQGSAQGLFNRSLVRKRCCQAAALSAADT
jgi:hypothetical protein